MRKLTAQFCHIVMYLDRIPRYGRYYTWNHHETDLTKKIDPKPHWSYMKNGHWGLSLLDKLGLLWKYIDHTNPGWACDDFFEDDEPIEKVKEDFNHGEKFITGNSEEYDG